MTHGNPWPTPLLWLLRSSGGAALLYALVLAASALAQPYAAAGGFMRPQLVAGPGVVGAIATASHQGVMQAVWADPTGVWRRPLFDTEATPTQLVPAGSIRGLSATTAGGDIAVAWLERDLRTGKTRHSLLWRSRSLLLFETNLEVPMLVGEAGGAPWVLVAPRSDGRASLMLYRVSPAGELEEPVTLHSTSLSITGVRAAGSAAAFRGPAHVAWLEGRTAFSALGTDSEWFANVMSTALGSEPLALGLADVVDVRQAVAVSPVADGLVDTLWLTVDGVMELTRARQVGDVLEVVSRQAVDEPGRPVAFVGSDAYWIADAFIRRGTVDGAGRLVNVTSVVWSPVPVEASSLFSLTGATSEALAEDGARVASVTTLAWYGREQGGKVSAYASDDSVAFVPGLTDEIAKVMQWSPWTAWQEAVGQALTAALAGMIVTLALAPLLFVLALVAARARGAATRPALLGAVIGIVTPVLILMVVALRYPVPPLAVVLTLDSLFRASPWLVLGGVAGHLIGRRSDNEGQLVTFIAAASAALIATSALAFVNYHVWAAFVGII